jgi:hypothetical protein
MFGVSGILSVVVVGLGMGRIGKYSIPPEAAHSLEAVMHAIGAIAESAIFFFSGIVANVAFKNLKVFSSENWSGGGDIHNHILVLFILFITIHVVRLISILIGLPILKSNNGLFGKGRDGTSYGLRDKELFVILMSGLRGAVGLALATILVQEHSTSSHKETLQVLDELFFYVAGVTVLTLMLNGTLISPFYDWLNVYPELRQKMLDRGSSMKSFVRGIEHDMEKQWEKKSKHDHLFKEISENQEDLRELMYMVPRFDRFIITSTGHLKLGKQVNSLAHIRGLLPKTAARFKDQRGTYEATSSTSFSLDGWKDMQEHTTMLEKEYIYLESTHRVETHEASLDQANSLRAADTFSPPISPLSQKKSSPFSLSSSPSFTGTLSKSSSKDKKKLDNKEETPILEEETKDVNNKPRNSVANDDDDQGVQNEKFGQLTDGKGMGLILRSASNAAIVSNTMSVSPTSCSLKIARLDQTYVTLVFTALDRLYKQQYETHELTENALVELDLARHEAVMLYEQKLVTLQAMSHTEYNQVLEKNQTSNIKINGAPARSRLSMMLVNMHKKQADAILERCLITELESMVASLPDPLALHRFILQLGVFGRILYAFCPPLRWILSYFCFGRVYQCVEILTGYIRAHEDLPGFIAHMDNEDGGRLEGGLKQRISNIQKAVSTVAKGKLELLGKAFPEAVHLTKLTMCAQVFAHMKLGAIHAIQQKGMLAEHDVDVLKEPVATALDDMFHCKDSFKMRVLVNESLSYHIFDDSSWLGQCFISKPKNNSSSSSSSSSSHDIESASSVKTEKWETELVKRNDRSNSSSSVGSNLGIHLGTEL